MILADDDPVNAGRMDTGVDDPSCRKAKLSRYLGLVVLEGRGGGVDRRVVKGLPWEG